MHLWSPMTKEARIYNGEKAFFNNWCWENWTATCKRIKLEHSLIPYTKINSKWITEINVRPDTTKLLDENTKGRQNSLEKEEWGWRNQPSWLQIILQSYIYKDSIVLEETQKYKPMEQDRKPSNKPMYLWVPYFWKKARTYNGAKTPSSINGAGKTGQLHAKEWN